jgi:hypothetical protein
MGFKDELCAANKKEREKVSQPQGLRASHGVWQRFRHAPSVLCTVGWGEEKCFLATRFGCFPVSDRQFTRALRALC